MYIARFRLSHWLRHGSASGNRKTVNRILVPSAQGHPLPKRTAISYHKRRLCVNGRASKNGNKTGTKSPRMNVAVLQVENQSQRRIQSPKGLTTCKPSNLKSRTLRVTTVISRERAVAASIESVTDGTRPLAIPSPIKRPQRSAMPLSNPRILPSNPDATLLSIHISRDLRRKSSFNEQAPLRSSPKVITETKRSVAGLSVNQFISAAFGSRLRVSDTTHVSSRYFTPTPLHVHSPRCDQTNAFHRHQAKARSREAAEKAQVPNVLPVRGGARMPFGFEHKQQGVR